MISEIILHCSATREGRDFRAKDIDRWHKQRGFNGIGYNYVIDLDGTVEKGRPVGSIGAHTVGHNAKSIGICYIGGLDQNGRPKDTRTDAQKKALEGLIKHLLKTWVGAKVSGHNQWARKACPSFWVPEWCQEVGIPFDATIKYE